MLVPTNESKEKIKKYEELWSKIKDLIRSITKNLDDYDGNYMKIKFNSDDKLHLNKTIEIPSMIIVARAVFHDNDKYYSQFFLDECRCILWIIQKCSILIELTFLKELMLIKQARVWYLSLLVFIE